ncbi:MAG: Tol-Pal system protein TolQ [Holosporales bacterium]
MESSAIQAVQGVGAPIAVSGVVNQMPQQNMSMFDLFLSAEPLVKAIMFGLIIASIWSWAIIFIKIARVYKANRDASVFEEAFWSGGSLDDLFDRIHTRANDPMSAIFCAAMREWRRSVSKGTIRGTLEQRIERVMQVTLGREMEELEKRMTFLASLGSNGMIVGLFGTVIGIMNSFENIAAQQNTNLAVVAPGIAEALFATAIGLIAAIPAAIAFNKISSDLNRFANRLDTFCSEFGSIISRQLEENV